MYIYIYHNCMDPMGPEAIHDFKKTLRTLSLKASGNIFGSNLGRLQQIKAKYDANNVPLPSQ